VNYHRNKELTISKTNKTKGQCQFCGQEYTRGGMARHLRACSERDKKLKETEEYYNDENIFHLQINSRARAYWLHLEMRSSAKLTKLDNFLREIWFDTSEHLSEFSEKRFGGRQYSKSDKAYEILRKDFEMVYIYDFGTTSQVNIRVADKRKGPRLSNDSIYLMARNNPPETKCGICGKPATSICRPCSFDKKNNYLCDKHTQEHEHEQIFKIENTPRTGRI